MNSSYAKSLLLKTLLLICALGLAFSGFSQNPNFLMLKKEGKIKRYYYYPGDEIQFRTKGGNTLDKLMISNISDSAIHSGENYILYSQIGEVFRPKRRHLLLPDEAAHAYLLSIGVSLAIVQVAYLINTGSPEPAFGKGTLYILSPAPIIYLSNAIKRMFTKRYYTITEGDYILQPVIIE